jgi:hypothetical protein
MSEKPSRIVLDLLDSLLCQVEDISEIMKYIHNSHKPIAGSFEKIVSTLTECQHGLDEVREGAIDYIKEENNGEHLNWMNWTSGIDYSQADFDIRIGFNDNGDVPHFHVVKGNARISIQFENPLYYDHECARKGDYLTYAEKKKLIVMFNKKIEYSKFHIAKITWWDYACLVWNTNKNKIKLPDGLEMPNYMELREK